MSSISAIIVPVSDQQHTGTIMEFFGLFGGEIHDFKEFLNRVEEVERRFGRFELLNDLITWKADIDKIYLTENCSSIYALLGQRRFGSLPHEKSSICGAINRAKALVSLTTGLYHRNMIEYLERQGQATGRGIYDADNAPIGFALADFAFHKTKLIPLQKLVQSGKDSLEPVWDKFFDSGYSEYKTYCFSKMSDKPGGSFGPRGDPAGDSHRPGGSPKEGRDPLSGLPDPFMTDEGPILSEDAESLANSIVKPVRLLLPKFSTEELPWGALPRLDWLFTWNGELTMAGAECRPL